MMDDLSPAQIEALNEVRTTKLNALKASEQQMQSLEAGKAQAEAYEADPVLMKLVCAAGGYDRALWRAALSGALATLGGVHLCGEFNRFASGANDDASDEAPY